MSLRQVRTETVCAGVFLQLDRVWIAAGDETPVPRDVVRHPGGVGILPVDGDDVVLVRQYRVALDREVLEIPAGKLDKSDLDPATAAARELREELGLAPRTLISLGQTIPSPGYTSEIIHLFAADGILDVGRDPAGVEETHAEVVRIPLAEAVAMLDDGRITDAKTQVALVAWMRRR